MSHVQLDTRSTLPELIAKDSNLLELLEDADTYTQALEALWEQNSIELKTKIDAYGYVIEQFKANTELLKERKKHISELIDRQENGLKLIKQKLHYFANGEKLIGNEFKFHPFLSKTSSVIPEKVCPEEKRYVYEVNWEQAKVIEKILNGINPGADVDTNPKIKEEYTVKEKLPTVTSLPEGHPAIAVNISPSVRVT